MENIRRRKNNNSFEGVIYNNKQQEIFTAEQHEGLLVNFDDIDNNSSSKTSNNVTAIQPWSAISPFQSAMQLVLESLQQTFKYITPYVDWIQHLSSQYFSFWATDSITEEEKRILQEFRKYVTIPYDTQNEAHEKTLFNLFTASFPNVALEDRITKQWKELGFQGKDPATDFRGTGVFGLKNLVYFAENYPIKFNEYLIGIKHFDHYPFAVTGINITNALFEILGWGFKQTSSTARVQFTKLLTCNTDFTYQEKCFQEVYCLAFTIFDNEWSKASASYFLFPKIIATARERLENELKKITTLDQVITLNRTAASKTQISLL